MANATRYSELRRRFTEEWINVGDCGVSHCTQSCCIGLESLFDTFGIEQDDMEEHFDGRCKSYRPTELLLESLRESKVFDWTGTFRVLNDLRQRRAWELENPLDGYMEVPEMVGDILTRLDWPNGFEKMRSQLPSTNRDRLHQWFVRAFVDELFPDSLLKKIAAK